jgi:hypothetical protein
MKNSIYNVNFPMGNMNQFPEKTQNKYTCDVYQGDTGDIRFMDSAAYSAGSWIPTGSVAHIENNIAKPGLGEDTASAVKVPFMVFVGNDKKSTVSEKGNATGGLVTLLPLTGYFRFVTTVFDASQEYKAGDLLTVGEFTFDGKTVFGVTKAGATRGTATIVGVVDSVVGTDVKGNNALKFTAMYIPKNA